MKKIGLISILYISFAVISCTKEDPANFPAGNNVTGKYSWEFFTECSDWTISSFIKNNIDLTKDYSPVKLRFCPDNIVTLSNDLLSVPGHWYFQLDKGNPNYMTLDFDFHSTGEYWTNLEGNWKILMLNEAMIKLQTDDGVRTMLLQRTTK